MITAQEARQLSGPTILEMCEFFDSHIRKAAEEKKREVLVYHGSLENEAYGRTKIWDEFVETMKQFGFDAHFHYVESQFVDMRIKITW